MNKNCVIGLLSLSQRERPKGRDCHDFQAPAKSHQERCRVLREPDDSKNGLWQSLVQTEIFLGFDHVSHVPENHDPSRRVRSRVSTPGNTNPRRKDQAGAVAGIYRPRTFDFEDVARECARNQSRSCGGNERASLTDSLIIAVSCEKRNCRPLTSILSPQAGRGGAPHWNRNFRCESNE